MRDHRLSGFPRLQQQPSTGTKPFERGGGVVVPRKRKNAAMRREAMWVQDLVIRAAQSQSASPMLMTVRCPSFSTTLSTTAVLCSCSPSYD